MVNIAASKRNDMKPPKWVSVVAFFVFYINTQKTDYPGWVMACPP